MRDAVNTVGANACRMAVAKSSGCADFSTYGGCAGGEGGLDLVRVGRVGDDDRPQPGRESFGVGEVGGHGYRGRHEQVGLQLACERERLPPLGRLRDDLDALAFQQRVAGRRATSGCGSCSTAVRVPFASTPTRRGGGLPSSRHRRMAEGDRGPPFSTERERLPRERGQRLRGHPDRRDRVARGVAVAAVRAPHAARGSGTRSRAVAPGRDEGLDRPRRRLDVGAAPLRQLEAAVAVLVAAEEGDRAPDRRAASTPALPSAWIAAAVSFESACAPACPRPAARRASARAGGSAPTRRGAGMARGPERDHAPDRRVQRRPDRPRRPDERLHARDQSGRPLAERGSRDEGELDVGRGGKARPPTARDRRARAARLRRRATGRAQAEHRPRGQTGRRRRARLGEAPARRLPALEVAGRRLDRSARRAGRRARPPTRAFTPTRPRFAAAARSARARGVTRGRPRARAARFPIACATSKGKPGASTAISDASVCGR